MTRYNIAKPLLKLLLIKNFLFKKSNFIKTIVYHDVSSSDMVNFKKQIEFIDKQYGFIDPNNFENLLFSENYNHKKILLTFDDGFKSNIYLAKEILSALNIKALFFIPTGFINTASRDQEKDYIKSNFFNDTISEEKIGHDMGPMSWHDLNYLKNEGHIIGAHTINHNKLSQIKSLELLKDEIVGCGKNLKKVLGIPIDHFAYSFGDINSINKEAIEIIKKYYKFCHSTIRGNNYSYTSSYALLRDPISPKYPIEYLQFIIENGFGLLYNKRSRLLNNLTYN